MVEPGYLASPGDADEALEEFLDEHPGWSLHRPGAGEQPIAVSECLTGRVLLDHEPGYSRIRWTVAAYDSPIGDRAWRADFDTHTPHEVALAVAEAFSYAQRYTGVAWEEAHWGLVALRTALVAQMREADWQDVSTHEQMAYRSPDGTAGLIRQDRGAYHTDPDGDDELSTVILWGQPPGGQRWQATFSTEAPTRMIAAALDHLTDPRPALRRRNDLAATEHAAITIRPAPVGLRARLQAALARTALPAERRDTAAQAVTTVQAGHVAPVARRTI
ncbi:hypothetical protein KNE206_53660 [Kitasatospora sp. NE20-6]